MKNCFVVIAKMDENDAPFRLDVAAVYPDNYPLVPGHVWVISAPPGTGAYEVAENLKLGAGPSGIEDASGLVVPAEGYWGYGQKKMWDFMDAPYRGDDALRHAG